MKCAIAYPLGLGDSILMTGAAEYLSKEYNEVIFPCDRHYLETISSIFRFNNKVKIYPLNVNFNVYPDGLFSNSKLFIASDKFYRYISFSENYYKNIGLDYSIRWDYCPISRSIEKFIGEDNPDWHPYCFVHDDANRCYSIDSKLLPSNTHNIYRPIGFSNLLEYATRLFYADEIHCMDSCFMHLVESLNVPGRLYFHEYAKPGSLRRVKGEPRCPTRKTWIIYPQSSECELEDSDCELTISLLSEHGDILANKVLSKNGYFREDGGRFLSNFKTIQIRKENLATEFLEIDVKAIAIIKNKKIIRKVAIPKTHADFTRTYMLFSPGDIQC